MPQAYVFGVGESGTGDQRKWDNDDHARLIHVVLPIKQAGSREAKNAPSVFPCSAGIYREICRFRLFGVPQQTRLLLHYRVLAPHFPAL
jgi:hypothetical protein